MVGELLLSLLGQLLLLIAICASLHHIIRPEKSADSFVRIVTAASQSSPFLLLAVAFIIDAENLDLVVRYGGSELPLLYRISAVWSSRSGPLLLWAAIMGIVTLSMSSKLRETPLEIRIMHGWTSLLLVLASMLDPFKASSSLIGGGLNPLLQTDLMVIHPPIVFAFYSLCIATASVALAGVMRGDEPLAIHISQLHWARAGFLVGTIGIGLGGLWAYTVLDWGGYWAWDPVETGSLLPWLALLIVMHARANTNSLATHLSPAVGMLAGALAFHATLVTRANGVWASVHAFVSDGEGSLPQDPYLRVLEIVELDAIGAEILGYIFSILLFCYYAVSHLRRQQADSLRKSGRTTLVESNRNLSMILVISFVAVSLWIGSVATFLVGLSAIVLLVEGDAKKPPTHWVALGVTLMLFSSWTWNSEWYQAFAGMIPFFVPWIMTEEEDGQSWAIFNSISSRTRAAKSFPWYGGSAFLLLTWMILTVEIDGTSLEAHEFYGAPIIGLLALSLATYSWGNSVDTRTGNTLLVLAMLLSLAFAYFADMFSLPGDPHLPITSFATRGALSIFLITLLAFSLPPVARQAWKTGSSAYKSLSKADRRKLPPARIRLLASHLAHLGILLLLVGHVMTTTLVDRSDPSHLVTLVKDEPVKHGEYDYTLVETVAIDNRDEDFRFDVGDAYLGVVVEMRKDGELVDTLEPGILRFGVMGRSEVDRHVGLFGDTILILDGFQVQDLMPSIFLNETGDIDRIRVTVHELQGSHLVWGGWVITILATGLAFLSSERSQLEEE